MTDSAGSRCRGGPLDPASRWLGTVPYREALARQHAHREALIAEEAGPELWGLEHPPVITLGRRAVDDVDPARIQAAGFELVQTERGGLATCHEPGQLVVYLLVDIREIGVRRTVDAIERGVIAFLASLGLSASRSAERPGIWVANDKVCAIGLHVRAGRTMHGLALNLRNDLRGFALITPCGLTDAGVTSVQRLLEASRVPTPAQAFAPLSDFLRVALLDAAAAVR
jgi:lipoyl(octanoyl) transferase